MRKKNYKGAKCTKRYVNKCDDVCKTYDAIQYVYANLLSETEEVKSFQGKRQIRTCSEIFGVLL